MVHLGRGIDPTSRQGRRRSRLHLRQTRAASRAPAPLLMEGYINERSASTVLVENR